MGIAHQFIKWLVTVFTIVLIPVYWNHYGPGNFLWLSDISLLLSLLALWLRSPLLISIVVVAVLPVEIFWNIDFIYHLIRGEKLFGIADYMFDESKSLFLRSLSLFHVFLPPIWIFYLRKWGYDRRAFFPSIAIQWGAFVLSRLLTSPKENINWVFIPYKYKWEWISSWQWLILLMVLFPLLIYLPMHLFLKKHVKDVR